MKVTSSDGKRTVTLFVEKKSKRLTGMAYTEQGINAEETFGDYKSVSGLEIAYQRTTKSAQVDLTTTLTDVSINSKVDESVFARPAARQGEGAAKPDEAAPKPEGAAPAPEGAAPKPTEAAPKAPATKPAAPPKAGTGK